MKVTVCIDYFTDESGSTMLCKDFDLPLAPVCGDLVELIPDRGDWSAWHEQVERRYIGPDGIELHVRAAGNRLDEEHHSNLRAEGYRRPGEREVAGG